MDECWEKIMRTGKTGPFRYSVVISVGSVEGYHDHGEDRAEKRVGEK
jgi:hypothetical protein